MVSIPLLPVVLVSSARARDCLQADETSRIALHRNRRPHRAFQRISLWPTRTPDEKLIVPAHLPRFAAHFRPALSGRAIFATIRATLLSRRVAETDARSDCGFRSGPPGRAVVHPATDTASALREHC